MALTLVEAAKLSQDVLRRGVIETIYEESDILKKLPFEDITGNGLTYNKEATLGDAEFYSPNDTWNESTPTFSQAVASLKILGGDADLDEFLKKTRSNIQDVESVITTLKTKSVQRKFEDYFIYGNETTNPKGFNGLHLLVASANKIHAGSGSSGAAGSIAKLRQLVRTVKPGKPDFLILNRTMRDNLCSYAERNYSPVNFTIGDFGKTATGWDGIPFVICDYIGFVESISGSDYSAKTGGATSTIFAGKWGEEGVCGLHNGGIVVDRIGKLETKDASRTRIKWYVSLACFNTSLSLARYDGITDAAWGA